MMPLGLSIASHSGLPPDRIGEIAATAERAGFSSVFIAEGHGDALTLCYPVAAATSRVEVGTAIANAALRPPVLAAKTTELLSRASGGRFILGLGTGNPFMNGQFGLAPFAPLPMMEEYVAVVRAVLAGQPYEGALFNAGWVPLDVPRPEPVPPVYLAALGPRMLALAGRIADGVLLNLMSPEQAGRAADMVRSAAAGAGRDPASVRVACVVHCCLSADAVTAEAAARAVVPRYVLHPAAPRLFGGDLDEVRRLTMAGDRAGAAARVPLPVAAEFVAYGDADACRARVAEYAKAGIDLAVVFPVAAGAGWDYESVITTFAGVTP